MAKKRTRRVWNDPIVAEAANKKYVVRLSFDERERLESLIAKGKSAAQHLRKARILLKADVLAVGGGWSDSRIAEALNTNVTAVHLVRKQLVEEGFEAVFTRKKRTMPPVPKIFDGEKEARLIALSCSKPPAGYARWSLRLLENKVVELGIVEEASDSTIGRVLKKHSQASPQETMGYSAQGRCVVRRRHGRCVGRLLSVARSQETPCLSG